MPSIIRPTVVAVVLAVAAGGTNAGAADTSDVQGHERSNAYQTRSLLPSTGSRIVGSGEFPGGAWGDPADASQAARDVRIGDVYHQRSAGDVTAVARFRAAPTDAQTAVAFYLGTRSGEGCQAQTLLVAPTKGGRGIWRVFDSGGVTAHGELTARRLGTRTVMSVRRPAVSGRTYSCSWLTVTNLNGDVTYDQTGFVDWTKRTQRIERRGGTHLHTGFVVGRRRAVKVRVENTLQGLDTSDMTRVDVGLTARGPAKVHRALVSLGTLSLVQEKTASFPVTLRQRRLVHLDWTAAGDYGVATGTLVGHPLGKPMTTGRSLVGRRFWAEGDLSWQPRGLWFVNRRFVFVGFPDSTRPTCRHASKRCKRYRFTAKSGRVVIDGKRGRVHDGRLTWTGSTFRPMQVPAAGSRWWVDLTHTNATTAPTLEYLDLHLRPGGTFWTNRSVWARRAVGAVPEGSGRYAVKKNGVLVLTYRSGAVVRRSLAVLTAGDNRPNPWDAGLMVGKVYYDE